MRTALLALLVSVGVASGAGACGGDSAPGGREAAEDSAADRDSRGRDSLTSHPDSLADPADSAGGDPRPVRARLLRLVNARDGEVVVHAAAGRGWVVLDTVPAGDSTRVRVESRARKVGVRAVEAGRAVAADSVDLTGSGPARWRIPPGTPPPLEDRSRSGNGSSGRQPPISPRTISMVSVTLK